MHETKYIICDRKEKCDIELLGLIENITKDGKPCCVRILDANKEGMLCGLINKYVDDNIKRPDGQYLYQGTFVSREVPVKAYLKYSRAVEVYCIKTVNEPIIWVERGE